MVQIIAPRRDEALTSGNSPTQRVTKFFESLTVLVNDLEGDIATRQDVDSSGPLIASLRSDIAQIQNDLADNHDYSNARIQNQLDAIQDELAIIKNRVNAPQEGLMVMKGSWAADVIYDKGNLATQNGWGGVANKRTIDDVKPSNAGDANYLLGDAPAWTPANVTATVDSGQRYNFSDYMQIEQIRVWPANVNANTVNTLVSVNITNPLTPIYTRQQLSGLIQDQWNVVAAGIKILTPNNDYLIYLETIDSGSSTIVTGGWAYSGSSNNGTPATQSWNRRNQNDIIRINKTDLNSTNRASELLSVTPGSIIDTVQTSDANNNASYSVDSILVDGIDYVEYGVTLLNQNGTIGTGQTTTINIDIPVPNGVDYVSITNFFPTNNPSFASVSGYLALDGVEQLSGNSMFCVDITGTLLEPSADWDIISFAAEFYNN